MRIRYFLASFLFLSIPAGSLGSEEDSFFRKYPVPSEEYLLPSRPIDIAIDFVSCSQLSSLPDELSGLVQSISESHYLDDYSVFKPTLERFADQKNEVATVLLAAMWDEGSFGESNDDLAASLLKSSEPDASGFYLSWYSQIWYDLSEPGPGRSAVTDELVEIMLKFLEREPENTYVNARLGHFYGFLEEAPTDREATLSFLNQAILKCEKNSGAKSLLGRALVYMKPDDSEEQRRAAKLIASGAESGRIGLLEEHANYLYDQGDEERAAALALYEKAAGLGSTWSTLRAAEMHENGEGTQVNLSTANYYYRRSAHLGDWDASLRYAKSLRDGIGVPRDPSESLRYFDAALAGNEEFWFELPQTLELIGDKDSLERAYKIYSARATSEDDVSQRSVLQAQAGADRSKQRLLALENADTLRSANVKPNQSPSSRRFNVDLDFGDYHALLIGNEAYSDLPVLESARADAEDLALVLSEDFGFSTEVMINATREQILNRLNEYRFSLKPTDNFFLFYAGHGTYDSKTEEGFWQPIDAGPTDTNWISNDRITRTLRGFQSQNVMVVADSCYSGIVFRDGVQFSQSPSLDRSDYLRTMLEKKTRVAFTSGGLEPVIDAIPGERNSIFTASLIDRLKQTKGILTASEVFLSVSPLVSSAASSLGLSQTPEFAGIRRSGHEGGDFIFVPSPK